jgi:AraC-like DNA-binding protein
MNTTIYKDTSQNAIRVSKILKLETEAPFTGLGIKYVLSGQEEYLLNNKKFIVKEGEYIIGNDFTSSIVKINQSESAQGVCIDISPNLVSEVVSFHNFKGADLSEFLLSDQLFVNRYKVENTYLGKILLALSAQINSEVFENESNIQEQFYELTDSLILDQKFVFEHLQKMEFKKIRTNDEVFRALLQAKTRIDESLSDHLSVDQISSETGISKYHFIRVFKKTFGLSPYQYQKQQRLEQAKIELLNGESIFDTSVKYGFADVSAFSKAFRQCFGRPPGQMRN